MHVYQKDRDREKTNKENFTLLVYPAYPIKFWPKPMLVCSIDMLHRLQQYVYGNQNSFNSSKKISNIDMLFLSPQCRSLGIS